MHWLELHRWLTPFYGAGAISQHLARRIEVTSLEISSWKKKRKTRRKEKRKERKKDILPCVSGIKEGGFWFDSFSPKVTSTYLHMAVGNFARINFKRRQLEYTDPIHAHLSCFGPVSFQAVAGARREAHWQRTCLMGIMLWFSSTAPPYTRMHTHTQHLFSILKIQRYLCFILKIRNKCQENKWCPSDFHSRQESRQRTALWPPVFCWPQSH